MTTKEKLHAIAKVHGADCNDTVNLYQRLLTKGATPEAALVAIRFGYSLESGKHEYFTAKDLTDALGMTEYEAQAYIDESKDKITVTYPEWFV